MGEQNSELLLSMLRDLNNKVDGLPTRHEFDAFGSRFDAMQDKFDKYVLKSEFDTYKQYADQRLNSKVKALEDKHDTLATTVDEHADAIDAYKANRLPSWVFPVVLAVATIIVQIWGNLSHNNHDQLTQQQQQAPAAASQRITK